MGHVRRIDPPPAAAAAAEKPRALGRRTLEERHADVFRVHPDVPMAGVVAADVRGAILKNADKIRARNASR